MSLHEEIREEAEKISKKDKETGKAIAEMMGHRIKKSAKTTFKPITKPVKKVRKTMKDIDSYINGDKRVNPTMEAKAIGNIAISNADKYKQPIQMEVNDNTVEIIPENDMEEKKDKKKSSLVSELLNNPIVKTLTGFAMRAMSRAENGLISLYTMKPHPDPLR